MPVTFSVAAHPANPIEVNREYTAREILDTACQNQRRYVDEVLHLLSLTVTQSERVQDGNTTLPNTYPDAQGNGFVNTVLAAYNEHRALVIRPDDVWLTILSQFNFFVSANAELLRANFVAHGGKKELVIWADILDFAVMSRKMVGLIEKNLIDPTLREWVMPRFTTTTENDTTVAAVLVMATLKQYFAYSFGRSACGPTIRLQCIYA
ncbi:hypothetical protein K438DRAFT_1972077 [Mycena galopus ATCC 62051]|nr:hypothetical protein K438DRAFT_1972077 [Mycena galopus ATCC 62051]